MTLFFVFYLKVCCLARSCTLLFQYLLIFLFYVTREFGKFFYTEKEHFGIKLFDEILPRFRFRVSNNESRLVNMNIFPWNCTPFNLRKMKADSWVMARAGVLFISFFLSLSSHNEVTFSMQIGQKQNMFTVLLSHVQIRLRPCEIILFCI